MANNTALIGWAANGEADLAGYKIYYSMAPTISLGVIDVGNVTSKLLPPAALPNFFTADGVWFFGVSAYDTSGNESAVTFGLSKRIIRTGSNLIRRR